MSTRNPRGGDNPHTDPFANDEFSPEDLQEKSSHVMRLSQFFHRQKLSLVFLGICLFLVLLFGGLLIGIVVKDGADDPDGGLKAMCAFTILPLIGVVALGFYCGRRYALMPGKVTVDPSGLTWTIGGGKQNAGWDDIASVLRDERVTLRRGEVDSWESNLIILFEDGDKLVLDHSFTDYKEMVAKIEHFGALAVLPKKQAEFEEGEAAFGPVILETDQIRMELGANDFYKKISLEWDELARWGACNGEFVLFDREKNRHHCGLGAIPNYRVLFVLIEVASGKRMARPASLYESE
jgi:hypothetical protein